MGGDWRAQGHSPGESCFLLFLLLPRETAYWSPSFECLVVSLSGFGGAYIVSLSIKNKEILVFAIRDIPFFFSSGETTALFLSNLIFLSLCQILSYLSASKLYCHHSLLFGLLFIRSFLFGYPLPCVN